MSTAAAKRFTVAEYLAFERASETKHEFYDGEVFAMTGASEPHNLIVGNIVTSLNVALRDRQCRVYPSDMRVFCPTGLWAYPDVSVVCGEPRFDDNPRDTLLNPEVVIEVLSPSTETYDRGRKFEHYQSIDSLREYLLVSQDRVRVEHYTRRDNSDEWTFRVLDDPGATVHLAALDCDLALTDMYAQVDFPPPAPPHQATDAASNGP